MPFVCTERSAADYEKNEFFDSGRSLNVLECKTVGGLIVFVNVIVVIKIIIPVNITFFETQNFVAFEHFI